MNAEKRQQRKKEGAEKSVAVGGVRKKYASPELVIYGNLVELTGNVGNDSLDPGFAGSRQTG